jgi:DNA-directed RNA polymerase subunit M/transcription elongation factor TFIIS
MLSIASPEVFQTNIRRCFRAAIVSTQECLRVPFAALLATAVDDLPLLDSHSAKEECPPIDATDEILTRLTKFSVNLENGILNYTIQEANSKKIIKKWENPLFFQIYKDRCRSVFVNLKRESVISQIMENSITPQELAFATHQEMAPDQWKELIDRKTKRDTSKYVNNTCASTDMFTCSKCRSSKCTYYELQTRSADEPMTVFVTCQTCGKNWKQ